MFIRSLSSVPSYCCLVLTFVSNSFMGRHDERSHRPMHVPRDDDHPSEGEGEARDSELKELTA